MVIHSDEMKLRERSMRTPQVFLLLLLLLLVFCFVISDNGVHASPSSPSGVEVINAQMGSFDYDNFDDFDGNNYPYGQWTQLKFADVGGPSPRVFAASTTGSPLPPPYAPTARTGFVVFGGTTDPVAFTPNFNDVWVLNPADDHHDGRTWTEVPITSGSQRPQPRCLR